MKEAVTRFNNQHPGYNIYINKNGKIVVERLYLSGPRKVGTYDSIDQIIDSFSNKVSCE